mmetsp:Transcript_21674/g.62313  ORF Transcript_21674/g.62313 Transcript_21674/m.62313 type:complete len:142 (-) Transcript_21674:64-489(-)|eukprot:CAMPEP_0176035466 /NCGR_PEP_ID=MMETSP0120_2-20121206/17548_1 /TAXON_ID=160619 /ORGANISM="Kryptoperidinium foliaceum, Strain CCMP 1326" /LENGTH=141 /DNA_ID=CAMNT_0017368829 /DNA_START=88 /DNA_END=513 /DNA_ORIENTATION=+
MVSKFALMIAALLCLTRSGNAFSVVNMGTSAGQSVTQLSASRRAVLEASFGAIMGSVLVSAPALADEGFGDLDMPSEEEQKKSEEEAMKERLRRKAELQKAQSRPGNFADSMKAEREKQAALKKSKEERRNALCEELGRGC